MTLKTALAATVLIAAAAFAQEAPEPVPTVAIVEIKENRDSNDEDGLSISVDIACENCEAVPDNQCIDAVISTPDGPLLRHTLKALSPDFSLSLFFSDAVLIELVKHEGHSLGKRPSGEHRDGGCVDGPELAFGEPMAFHLKPSRPTVSIAGANIQENPDDDGRLWVFVYMACEDCESVPENQCVDARITWDEDEGSTHRLVSRAHSPGFGFRFRVGRVDIQLLEHPGHGDSPVSEEPRGGCVLGPELAFGPTAQIDLHDGPHEDE